jgi:hypothetical protein
VEICFEDNIHFNMIDWRCSIEGNIVTAKRLILLGKISKLSRLSLSMMRPKHLLSELM